MGEMRNNKARFRESCSFKCTLWP